MSSFPFGKKKASINWADEDDSSDDEKGDDSTGPDEPDVPSSDSEDEADAAAAAEESEEEQDASDDDEAESSEEDEPEPEPAPAPEVAPAEEKPKPSLRTRVSLEVGMTEMGGHAISYMIGDSPLGKKETYGDTGACLSRYVCAITARVSSRVGSRARAQPPPRRAHAA